MTRERWRAVPGFEGSYEVSSRGRVRSVARTITRCNGVPYRVRPRILRPKVHRPSGLRTVMLARCGVMETKYIHVLVRELFGIERIK